MWSKQVYIILTKGKEMRAKSAHKAYLGRQTLLIQENFHPVPVWLYYISDMIALDLQPPQFGGKREPCCQKERKNPGKVVWKKPKQNRRTKWAERESGEGKAHCSARFDLRFFCCFTPFLSLSPTTEPGPRLISDCFFLSLRSMAVLVGRAK